jgi:hypothetical protein
MVRRRETEELGEKPLTVSLCSPLNPRGPTKGGKPGLRGERPANNRLNHDRA